MNNLKKSNTWKTQLTIVNNIMSSKDMHSKSHNMEILIGKETDEVIKELFESFLTRYQIGLEESMKSNDFFFDYVDLLYCKCHKISLNCVGSYIDSLD